MTDDPHRIPQEYFEDRTEQLEIQEAALKAIPENARLTNVILVLADLLAVFTHELANDEENANP